MAPGTLGGAAKKHSGLTKSHSTQPGHSKGLVRSSTTTTSSAQLLYRGELDQGEVQAGYGMGMVSGGLQRSRSLAHPSVSTSLSVCRSMD